MAKLSPLLCPRTRAGLHRLGVHEQRAPAEHRAPLRPLAVRAGAAARLPRLGRAARRGAGGRGQGRAVAAAAEPREIRTVCEELVQHVGGFIT